MLLSSILAPVESLLNGFYIDEVDINRRVKVTNADGSTSFSIPTTPLIESQPCSISFSTIDNPDTDDIAKNPQISVLEIIMSKDVKVYKGDTITAYKYNASKTEVLKTYEGIANEPSVYPTHQEVFVVLKGNA